MALATHSEKAAPLRSKAASFYTVLVGQTRASRSHCPLLQMGRQRPRRPRNPLSEAAQQSSRWPSRGRHSPYSQGLRDVHAHRCYPCLSRRGILSKLGAEAELRSSWPLVPGTDSSWFCLFPFSSSGADRWNTKARCGLGAMGTAKLQRDRPAGVHRPPSSPESARDPARPAHISLDAKGSSRRSGPWDGTGLGRSGRPSRQPNSHANRTSHARPLATGFYPRDS